MISHHSPTTLLPQPLNEIQNKTLIKIPALSFFILRPASNPMSSVCKSTINCVVDSRLPLRSSYINLYKWAQSDAEFINSVTKNRAITEPSHRLDGSYYSRQQYLRSYTFCRKETMPEKTVKCFGKVKEKATDFPFIYHQRKESGGSFSSFVVCRSCNKKKKKVCSVFYSIFRRLLSCSMAVDVADGGGGGGSQFGG